MPNIRSKTVCNPCSHKQAAATTSYYIAIISVLSKRELQFLLFYPFYAFYDTSQSVVVTSILQEMERW